MYDYLDAVTEEPSEDPFRDGQALFHSFAVALTPDAAPRDYYRFHPRREDSGYLDALVERARRAVAELPSMAAVLPVARLTAARFGDAQIRSHAVPSMGVAQLEEWTASEAQANDLEWWEWAGGAAASVLGLHALLSAAADVRTTRRQAIEIDRAYFLSSTLTTMLDSLIDDGKDAAANAHRYVAYYATPELAACRISQIARRAVRAVRSLPHAAHHTMTVAGIAGFYLSSPVAGTGSRRIVARHVIAELHPTILPTLATFQLWRWLRRYGFRWSPTQNRWLRRAVSSAGPEAIASAPSDGSDSLVRPIRGG
jgi:tetraprenyl-beta-curcumene synthase